MEPLKTFIIRHRALLLIVLGGMALHIALTLPGIFSGDVEKAFCRLDSAGYLAPARALAAEGAYRTGPGGPPHLERPPGLPLLLAAVFRCFGMDNLAAAAILLGLVGALTAIPVYLAGRELFSHRTGLLAALLFSLNLTVIANRPLLLSDTLFAFFIAWSLYGFLRFAGRKQCGAFLGCVALAAAAALIRPINEAWIAPALVLLAVAPGIGWKKKLLTGLAAALIFFGILFPWLHRNAALGAGYCIDTNTGAMYHQNGAMLLARVNGSSYEQEKQKILAALEIEFADRDRYPDVKSKTDYRLKKFRELVLAHPFVWFSQHLRPQVLLPDLPALCEILGIAGSDRGTLDVLQRHGLFAAVRHYFAGIYWIIPVAAPLLAIVLITYLGAGVTLVKQALNIRRDWFRLLVFLAFVEYYFFLPGPITVPRYQLPALPLLCVLAAAALPQMWQTIQRIGGRKKLC